MSPDNYEDSQLVYEGARPVTAKAQVKEFEMQAGTAVIEAPSVAPAQPPSESAAIVSMIERAARDPSVDIDKMERLLLMQERVIERQSKAAFDAALAAMQPELPTIDRRGRIEIREKDAAGKRTGDIQQSSKYALWEDINEAIRPVLAKHGFALSFRTGLAPDGKVQVTGILSHREGHREETAMVLQHDSSGSKNAVQAVGSSTSYGKRYIACALLNITTRGEDDDGKAGGDPGPISGEQFDTLRAMIDEAGADAKLFCQHFKIKGVAELPAAAYQTAVQLLEAKKKAKAVKQAKP